MVNKMIFNEKTDIEHRQTVYPENTKKTHTGQIKSVPGKISTYFAMKKKQQTRTKI